MNHHAHNPTPLASALVLLPHQWMQVTPAMATHWLDIVRRREAQHDRKYNRVIRQQRVETYARDMRNGNWTLNPQPIVFDTDGLLADGHHRLRAVILSQTTQTFLVVRDLPREYLKNLDCGAPRSPSDRLVIASGDESKNERFAAVAKKLALLQRWGLGTNPSSSELDAIHAAYGASIATANAMAGHASMLSVSPYRAALVGALHLHHGTPTADAISQFAAVVRHSLVDTESPYGDAANSALSLRRFLMGETTKSTARLLPHAIFRTTEYALRAFLDGRGLKRLQPRDDQEVLFPLPCPEFAGAAQPPLFD